MKQSTYQEISEHVDGIWVVDTHEHMPSEEEWLSVPEHRLDFSQLMHYIDLDIIAAGLPFDDMRTIRFGDESREEKWALFEPFWEKTRNTAFAKLIDRTVRDFYGLPGLNRDTYQAVGEMIREMRRPGRMKALLKESARIEVVINDGWRLDTDRDLFLPSWRLDEYMSLSDRASLQAFEESHDTSIGSLADLVRALTDAFKSAVEGGAVAIKSAQAYTRGLRYDYHSPDEASKAFDRAFGSGDADPDAAKVVSDFLFYRLAELCSEGDVPMQVHTGMAAGDARTLAITNPVLMAEVIARNPGTRFDLFHAGYPYWEELGVLAKAYANMRADLCWTHIISPAATRRALDEWLEVIPASKIFAFGGDLGSPEITATHLKLARDNVARVLAGKVEDGYLEMGEAKRIAEMILRENAAEFFGIMSNE